MKLFRSVFSPQADALQTPTQKHTKHKKKRDESTLTLLNGRTLTATLTQSLLCMSEALALMV